MARLTPALCLMALVIIGVGMMLPGSEGCPQYPKGQRCTVGHFLGPQWVYSGYDITNVTLNNDGKIEKWGPAACCAICGTYIDAAGKMPCVGFTLELADVNNTTATSICYLKSQAVPTGEKCPANLTCISGML